MSKTSQHILEQETPEDLSMENLLSQDPDYEEILDKHHKESQKLQDKKMSKALTWSELANFYDETHSSPARTLPMDTVFEWAEKQPDKFIVHPEIGTIHLKESQEEQDNE